MTKTAQVAATAQDHKMVVYKARDGQQVQLTIEIVRDFLVTGRKELVTVQEFVYFIGVCRARGLNPFAKDCYLIKYTESDPAAIVTAIDFYRSRAKAQPDCHGWEKGVICCNKESKEIRYSKGLVLADEVVVGGWFRATPTGWTQPFELEVNLSGYVKKTKDGSVTKFWREENQPTMIAKVAESQGLRTLWPDEFRGTITPEEAGLQLEQFEPLDITSLQTGKEPPVQTGQEPPVRVPAVDTSEFDKLRESKLAIITEVEQYKIRYHRIEEFIKETAASQKKKGITADQVKARACGNFEGFWSAFVEWEGIKYPPPAAEPPEAREPAGGPEGDVGPGATLPTASTNFGERQTLVWHKVVGKGVPLAELEEKFGIAAKADIIPENIDEVESFVNEYAVKGKK